MGSAAPVFLRKVENDVPRENILVIFGQALSALQQSLTILLGARIEFMTLD